MRVQCGWRKDCRGLERTGERLEGCGGGQEGLEERLKWSEGEGGMEKRREKCLRGRVLEEILYGCGGELDQVEENEREEKGCQKVVEEREERCGGKYEGMEEKG